MGIPLVDLDAAKELLNLPVGTADDDVIQSFLEVATDLIEQHVGPVNPQSFTETVRLSPTIVLSRAPIITVDSLAPVYPEDSAFYNSGYTYNVSDYLLDPAKGVLRRIPRYGYAGNYGGVSYGYGFSGLILVTYTAGYAMAPMALQQAAVQFVREMLRNRRRPMLMPGGGADPEDNPDSYGMPLIAAEMLRPFRRSAGIG